MKAINEKELRLGNLILGIYYTEDDEGEEIEHDDICEVLAINDGNHFANYSIYVDSKSDTEIFSSFHPIPLTEEWLVKLGFKKHDKFHSHRTEFSKGKFSLMLIEWMDDSPDFSLYKTPSGELTYYAHGEVPKIKSVHQLQNLYFALYGTELTVEKDEI